MGSDGFADTYGVELFCAAPPTLAKPDILAALRVWCPGVKPLDGDPYAGLLSFVHEDYPIQLKDARIAAQTFLSVTNKKMPSTATETALQQSWSFPGARQAVAQTHTAVLVTDLMSGSLPCRARLDLFQRALLGILSAVPCQAIHWHPSQRIVDPDAYITASRKGTSELFFAGAVNVRLFNIENSPGDIVMDTLGLAALGLPDLQCHFRRLDTDRMARLLFNTGWYLFQQGDTIQDGQTIAGIEPYSKWRCQHETALVNPKREVLDLNPGGIYAAGSRA